MRTRSISAIGVVIAGLVPTVIGGPVFIIAMTLLFLIGMSEFIDLTKPIGRSPIPTGYLAIPAFTLAASFSQSDKAVMGAAAACVFIPLCLVIFRTDLASSFTDWALAAGGALYLGIPLYAAIATRRIDGAIDARWLDRLAHWSSFSWNAAPRGLAWLLTIIFVTWLNDTGAYLVGRAAGRHLLIPMISPKKTVEGLVGGLACAAGTGALAVWLFGLGTPIWLGLALGIVLGAFGVVGDLAESLFKRQSGVKDSGALIPGHGGMLDRLDALLFTWTAGWFLVLFLDRWS